MKLIAINIENKRQFDALMKHYDEKGWKPIESFPVCRYEDHWPIVTYMDKYYNGHKDGGWGNYNIIDFDIFSQLMGVKVVDEIVINLPFTKIIVTNSGFHVETENGEDSNVTPMNGKTLEEIYTAYKSFQ